MKRYRGLKLGRRLLSVWQCLFRQRLRCRKHFLRLNSTNTCYYRESPSLSISDQPKTSATVTTKLLEWSRHLARRLHRRHGGSSSSSSSGQSYCRLGDDRKFGPPLLVEEGDGYEWKKPPPKGYLAVYVGGKKDGGEGPPQRYLVPVIYFNHPLFGELLRESEEEFGFQHPGGITIPCAAAQFEHIRTRIAGGSGKLGRQSG